MTWPERHELIINGIDFDAMLERERMIQHWHIEEKFRIEETLYIYKETGILCHHSGEARLSGVE